MLIEFKVSNYRSIGEEQVISLVPAPKQRDYPENVFQEAGYDALNVIAFYGANGSGKSNLLMALVLFEELVARSSRFSSVQKLPWEPFLLREGWTEKPTSFEITFILNNNRYRYGVEFKTAVEKEWLYRKAIGREVPVFLREADIIDASSALKAHSKIIDAAIESTKPNSLFLSICDMLNIEEATEIFKWFSSVGIVNDKNKTKLESGIISMWDDAELRKRILDYMVRMKTGIEEINMKVYDQDDIDTTIWLTENKKQSVVNPHGRSERRIPMASHFIYDKKGKKTTDTLSWPVEEFESSGTKKALQISGAILNTLMKGNVLIIDGIEANMHPIMTLDTINLFLNKEINKYGAQLIFTTHDTNLLSYAYLRRDQIYFAEKNNWESTEIYSLSDFKYLNDLDGSTSKERPDTDKEKRYIEGRYGAVPMLGKFTI